jgi:F-type H+-transporting ATPase subunit gamma
MALVTMREIKRKIRSIRNIQMTTKAMMLVAAAKLKRYEPQLKKYRIYKQNYEETLYRIIQKAEDFKHPFLLSNSSNKREGKVCVLIFTSDRGLCGAFNSNLCKYAISNISQNADIITIGKRGYNFFKRQPFNIIENLPMPDKSTQELSQKIVNKIITDFLNDKYIEILCIYNKFKSAIASVLTKEVVLPISIPKRIFGIEYLYEPIREEILDILLKQYIKIIIDGIFLESQTSEHSARMIAMEQATNNALKLIDKLWLDFNKVRQATITKEIADIINTSEALRR